MRLTVQIHGHLLFFLLAYSGHDGQTTGGFCPEVHHHIPQYQNISISITVFIPVKDLNHLKTQVKNILDGLSIFQSIDPRIRTQIFRITYNSLDYHRVCGTLDLEKNSSASVSEICKVRCSGFPDDRCLQPNTDSVFKLRTGANGQRGDLLFQMLKTVSQIWLERSVSEDACLLLSEKRSKPCFCVEDLTLLLLIPHSQSSRVLYVFKHSVGWTVDLDMNSTHQTSLFPANIDLFVQCCLPSELCSSELTNCSIPLHTKCPRYDALSVDSDEPQTPASFQDKQTSTSFQDLHEFSQIPKPDKYCVKNPLWFKLLDSDSDNLSCFDKNHYIDRTIINISALTPYVREMLFLVMALMTIIFKYLQESPGVEKTKNDKNAIHLKILTKSFFIKWTWQQEYPSPSAGKAVTQPDHQNVPWTLLKTSLHEKFNDTLNSYIFRPWLRKAMSRQNGACSGNCCSSSSSLCPSCRDMTAHPGHTMWVSPAFLPDPTHNPRKDLAHVGYRLATLAALPPAVDSSRVRLADAGFYSRGQGDEVTCYSCGASHSGWRRGDNPLDIHRQLSPNCEHVLEMDRIQSALSRPLPSSSQTSLHNGDASGHPHLPRTQRGAMNGSAEETPPPREDSEKSRPPAATESTQQPVFPRNESALPARSAAASGNEPGARGRETSTPSLANGHSASPELPRAGTGDASAMDTQQPTPRPPVQGSHNGAAVSSLQTHPSGVAPPSNSNTNGTSTTAANATSTLVAEYPPERSSRGQNEAAARASSRPLFPTPRLALGGAVYPMYQSVAARRRTFTHWDDSRAPSLDDVILSGMFYAGYADCVRCFYCGVGLKHWVVTDNVWDEHVRWRPECEYLRAIKGDAYISQTQRRLENETPSSPSSRLQPPSEPRGNTPTSSTDGGQQPSPPSQLTRNAANTTTTTRTTAHTGTANSSGNGPQALPSTAAATAAATTAAATTAATATAAATTAAAASPGTSMRSSALSNRQSNSDIGDEPGTSVTDEADNAATLARLREEHQRLSGQMQCRECRRAPIDAILMPCGHLALCQNCAGSVTSCPLCGSNILATAKVYFAD